ncbi:MAG: condensation domain-containing protein [Longicatena sp.]
MEYKANALDMIEACYAPTKKPVVYCHIQFTSHINIMQLHYALLKCIEVVPQLFCHFDDIKNVWIPIRPISTKALIFEYDKVSPLPIFDVLHDPQIRLHVVHEDTYDSLHIGMSHIVCDGSGFKQLLYMLCDFYNDPNHIVKEKNIHDMTRLSIDDAACNEKATRYKTGEMGLPFESDGNDFQSAVLSFSKEEFQCIHASAKQRGATINDIFLYAYGRVLQAIKKTDNIRIPCPADLRPHLLETPALTIGNFTGEYFCTFNMHGKDTNQILREIHNQMVQEKTHNKDLKLIVLLHRAYVCVPKFVMRKFMYKFHRTPDISYTNVGIFDETRLYFKDTPIDHFYISTSYRKWPRFQATLSTYKGECTLSCNLLGGEKNQEEAYKLLTMFKDVLTIEFV